MKEVPLLDENYREHLVELKCELANVKPPIEIERNLLRAFDAQFVQVRWWQKWGGFQWSIGVTVMASLLVALVLFQHPSTQLNSVLHQKIAVVPSPSSQALYEEIPFISLDSKEIILQQDTMRIVQADVPMTVLASMGVPVNPQIAGETTKAEMLVGRDDALLAVRFLPN